ncbi:MAG: anthranilate phosphoribosyltransferase [Ignavibacteriae bacterium]|nr:anthranilate phosphoribosyltransferase [Ignavibacteriota bacterium]NOG97443.1 anthranilate phosphoribosyltransferase [Ignavibacteriota bacterium]
MIKESVLKIIDGEDLSFEESFEVMNKIMTGKVDDSLIAALLTGLKTKGESASEIGGFASSMRSNGIKINCDIENTIDVCGTGGDNSGTFNISTAASFVVAGAGLNVAKHGNRSISSSSGSSDVLTELGVNISLSPEHSERALDEIGITFLFAPLYHPAMKHVAEVRRALGFKTIFNMLGPLTNPAGTKKQLIGVFNDSASEKMSSAVDFLDMERVCFICAENKYDEFILNGAVQISEYHKGKELRTYKITSDNFKYSNFHLDEIKGASAAKNAKIILSVLKDKTKNAAYYVVAANAALGLYASGFSSDFIECRDAAEESINSGKAFNKLEELKKYSIAV